MPDRPVSAPQLPLKSGRAPAPGSVPKLPGTIFNVEKRRGQGIFHRRSGDNVISVSGHRLATAAVESAIVAHPDVAEAAVIGQPDEDTGQAIVAFVTLRGERQGDSVTMESICATVAERIGKFACPKRVIWSVNLPKTRSGEIIYRALRAAAEGRAPGDATTLSDPVATAQVEERV